MKKLIALLLLLGVAPALAKVVVFWQDGFPTVASQPVTRATLEKALDGMGAVFVGMDGLQDPATLAGADLLALPYGSAVPANAWGAILSYLQAGGNLLTLGGQPLRVPVTVENGKFMQGAPQLAYLRDVGVNHTYEAPTLPQGAKFAWRFGYSFLRAPQIRARRFFVLEGRLAGLGYMVNADGMEMAAPVVVMDHARMRRGPGAGAAGGAGAGPGAGAAGGAGAGAGAGPGGGPGPGGAGGMIGSRAVLLDFEPEPGYWDSPDGAALIRDAADYARQGSIEFSLELAYSTLKPGETPQVTVHVRNARRERLTQPLTGAVTVELLSAGAVVDTARVECSGAVVDQPVDFKKTLPPGFYTVRGVYEDGGKPREFYQNGFWIEDAKMLTTGPALGVKGDFLRRDGQPFFPMGTNYFTTEENGWDFGGPRNAWVWERDFAEMERNGVTFVRTGVWAASLRFLDPATGGASERFLRNLEAYLLSARKHNIIVNFTFWAFMPRTGSGANQPPQGPAAPEAERGGRGTPLPPPGPNPYMDPEAIRAELAYALSVVNRFKDVPWLCWDLINEPSFSNPNRLWLGNTPNGDPVELAEWRKWLREKYGSLAELARAWAVTPEQIGDFDKAPLPTVADLTHTRYRNARLVRALDYNLFAQEMFTRWVRTMVTAIHGTGSKQLVNVGQDEGGVTNRVLNQFYAAGGVAFTTNHTYWRDDALLWDSVVAKRPGMPNITGETGYQPVWAPDGAWRYDELTGYALTERKWALGFAAGTSGALNWDWAREVYFGIKRSDGSAKIWQTMMKDMGQFAAKAAPSASGLEAPQVAIVLPQSLQLSVSNETALEAQQKAVRALYHHARAEAYAVGEYQIELLGNPKLIILPSPLGLARPAWDAIRAKVEAGATLLVSGVFDLDPHFHATGRQKEVGLAAEAAALTIREHGLKWPAGQARLVYGGEKTTYLQYALLPDGASWAERSAGKGKILYSPLPLELNDNVEAIGEVYRYALKVASVGRTYSTTVEDPGILICPARLPDATLYVLTSESSIEKAVQFRDERSGKEFSGALDPGRAALLLVGRSGALLASYNWKTR